MEDWLRERLSFCLGFDVPDDMILFVMSLKTAQEFDDYFKTLLNRDCEDHLIFLNECKKRLFSKALPNNNKSAPLQAQQQQQQQQRKSIAQGSAQFKQNQTLQNNNNNKQQTNQRKNQSLGSAQIKQISASNNNNSKQNDGANTKQQQQHDQGAKKKTKYVSLYSKDGNVQGEIVMLKGRRRCDCQATQHKLINNCLSCGRIVCAQEGSGACLFCGEIVCTADEMKVLKASDKKSENLLKTLKEKGGGGQGLKQALEQRDRLLEYDRNSEKRTTVIDDELDYFQENSVWLTDEERAKYESFKQEMHEKKHASRAKRIIQVDFAGREIEQLPINAEYEQQLQQQLATVSAEAGAAHNWSNQKHAQHITADTCGLDPNLDAVRPIFIKTAAGGKQQQPSHATDKLERVYNRVQDKELLEMQDMRQCLSMHQPYASLLVAGIKKHEGRGWYTEHRGRLWIASTVREAHAEEIAEVENFYRNYYIDKDLKFPEHYPTGCLLGCVKVDDCLAQEEYREIFPHGESDSPYVFICSNAEQLPVVFPIKGQHKIYQIDAKIHNAACKTLLRLQKKG